MKRNPVPLDRTDIAILRVLQRDGSLTAAQAAQLVGTTTAAASRRIKRLEDRRVITRRVALVDRSSVGLNMLVFARVKLSSLSGDALATFERAISALPEVLDCYALMGETDFLLRIATPDIASFRSFFLERLSRLPGVQVVNSSVALNTVKETTEVPLQ